MATIIVAAILISGIISISLFLVSINNKHRQKKTNVLLNHFSKLGTESNLSFSSQEILENCIIGLDGIQKKLLVLKQIGDDKYDSLLIYLNEVKSCSKKKIYRSVNFGTKKREKLDNHLDKIVLAFEFIDDRHPVHVLFFDSVTNHIFAMAELEQKARNWETILSQIINSRTKKIPC